MPDTEEAQTREVSAWEIEDIIDLRTAGFSFTDIANQYQFNEGFIELVCDNYKAQPYPMTEYITGENQ